MPQPVTSFSFAVFSPEAVEKKLSVDVAKGLEQKDIAAREKTYGKNVLHAKEVRWWHILGRQFRSPFIYLLIAAAVFSLVFDGMLDAILIFAFVVINTVLGFFQEYRSEHILATLKKYLVSHAVVRRDGLELQIDKMDIVPGDVVLLQAGDMLPADVRFVEVESLEIDESVLSGESVTVAKSVETLKKTPKEIMSAANIGFSGTTVVSGRGIGIVVATGSRTVFGGISTLASETRRVSDFEQGMAAMTKMIFRVVAISFFALFFIKLFFVSGNNLIELIIFSIALAVGVIPEGLPLVITFTLSYGAKRLAKNKVVVKRLSSIEDLGGIEILCTDKTGTITENKMRIVETMSIDDDKDQLLHYARLASVMPERHAPSHPFDNAIYAGITDKEKKELAEYRRMGEVPFDPIRKRNCVSIEYGKHAEVVVRGAPEEILGLSNTTPQLTKRVKAFIRDEGEKGHRVLAIAYRPLRKKSGVHLCDEEKNLTFLGCISLHDPLKQTSIEAIAQAKKLGVQIKILTGDGPEVAKAAGVQSGIITSDEDVVIGAAFMAASHEERKRIAETCHMFARVSPEEKYEIIKTLQESHTVGFLGEGINDAPALKIADVGMVVDNASDVAREAADIILLKKSLLVIVKGIEEGRRVFANNIKYLKATLASNFGNFYALVIAVFLSSFLPMLPIQILLLNLISDFPMMTIAADRVDTLELRAPRQYHIFHIVRVCLVLGLVSTIFDCLFFGLFYHFGPDILRTNWFVASVITELVFLFSVRTRLPFWKAVAPAKIVIFPSLVAAVFAVTFPFIPVIARTFHFVLPRPEHLLLIAGVIVVYFVCTETAKLLYYRKFMKHF